MSELTIHFAQAQYQSYSDHCVNCSCIGGGVISSPGFPQPYSINLHLIWHIQVPLGKYIRIVFIKFDVGETFSQIFSGKW